MVTAYLVHTAESFMNQVGPDTGAEGVAEFICTRRDPGSYHDLVDSDSIVNLIPPQWEAFHCRGGVNAWSMGLSFACRTTDWARMALERRTAFLRNGAKVAVDRIEWIEAQPGRPKELGPYPIRKIGKVQAQAGWEGFVGHGDMDEGRRSDPGTQFPWGLFLALVAEERQRRTQVTLGDGDNEMAKTWNLTDLGAVMDSVGALYEADTHRRSGGADPLSYEVRGPVQAGRAAWFPDVTQLLMDGKDPAPTLEYIRWQLANPGVKL